MSGLKQPDSFLDKTGPITMPWKTWVAQFENYLVASGGTNNPVARKKELLLHCLGKEGQRVFQNLLDHDNPPAGASEYDKALLVLEKHYGPKNSVVAEHYKFRQRRQCPGETAQDYVAALRELAVTCNFGAMRDEMIRDQLVENTISDKICEKLFMEENLTLARAIQVATHIEEQWRGRRPLLQRLRLRLQTTRTTTWYRKPSTRRSTSQPVLGLQKTRLLMVQNESNIANYDQCPALGQICNTCKRKDHFAKICTQRLINKVCNSDRSSDSESDEVQVLAIKSSVKKRKRFECNVQVNNLTLSMYVDSLADRSILDLVTFQQ